MDIDLQHNYFELFNLPQCFRMDGSALELAYHELHAKVHPDRHAHLSETERRRAMQWATQVNEGFDILKKPLKRAQYLLKLSNIDIGSETSTTLPPKFLMEQMEWYEGIEEARHAGDPEALTHLHARLRQLKQNTLAQLEIQLDGQHDLDAATDTVRRLMFIEKLQQNIDEAFEALED